MFQKFRQKTAINLVVGSLGAGKTTLIKNLLSKKPENENWAILVNEFGAIGIDQAILNNDHKSIQVAQIPGGCICCTALSGFQDAIEDLVANYTLDRILIEPTGLGEPESMVALLHTPYFQQHFEIDTTFAVLDSVVTKVEQFSLLTIMQNLVEVADIILLNKADKAEADNLNALKAYCLDLFPAKQAVITTTQANLEGDFPSLKSSRNSLNANNSQTKINMQPTANQPDLRDKPAIPHIANANLDNPDQDNTDPLADQPIDAKLKHLVTRKSQAQLNTLSIGWIFEIQQEFDWKALASLFEGLKSSASKPNAPLRAKGIFKVGKPQMLFQWVLNGDVTREYSAYCRDSRLEILLPLDNDFDLTAFEAQLVNCQK